MITTSRMHCAPKDPHKCYKVCVCVCGEQKMTVMNGGSQWEPGDLSV